MIKKDVLAGIVEKTGFSEDDARLFYKAFMETVIGALRDGERVQLVGFGTFDVVERAAHEGRSLRTGEVIQIPASKTPRFKAGRTLKNAVNG